MNNKNFVTLAALLLLIGLISGINKNLIISYLQRDPLLLFVTLVVGLTGLFIFYKQKAEYKQDAANIIYLEITNAERILKEAKEKLEQDFGSQFIFSDLCMQIESWSKYKYLFSRDFSRDEWDYITDFYNKAYMFDEAALQNRSYFQKNEEQIRINLHKSLADYVKTAKLKFPVLTATEKNKFQELINQTTNFYQIFMSIITDSNSIFFYSPKKPLDDAKLILNNLNLDISQSSAGLKLKLLANNTD